MSLPNRIVLSRKGCDEAYGKRPSFIIDGEMLSVPIPESHFVGGSTYSELRLPQRLRKNGRNTFADLINSIPVGRRGVLQPSTHAHLDPDIRGDVRCEPLPKSWKPRFGQCCSADAALRSITTGDLFIFFGWHVHAEWGSEVAFSPNKSFHSIWGWLVVGEAPVRFSDQNQRGLRGLDHPHFAPLREGCKHRGNRNWFYEAAKTLSFDPKTPGAGVFRYMPALGLTHPACRLGCRSLWRLPRFFHGQLKPFPTEAWCEDGNFTCVQAAGQNQEYVFERPVNGGLDEEIRSWLDCIFQQP